eukprot:Gb_04794 [translate_table: standard]
MLVRQPGVHYCSPSDGGGNGLLQERVRWADVDLNISRGRRSLDITRRPKKRDQCKSESDLSINYCFVEETQCPPSPICSPTDISPLRSSIRSLYSLPQRRGQYSDLGSRTLEQNAGAFYGRKEEINALYGPRKSFSSILDNAVYPYKENKPVRLNSEEESDRPRPRGTPCSMRRANLRRNSSCDNSLQFQYNEGGKETVSADAVVQAESETALNNTRDGSNDRTVLNGIGQTEASSEGFEPSASQQTHLPAINEEECTKTKEQVPESDAGRASTDRDVGDRWNVGIGRLRISIKGGGSGSSSRRNYWENPVQLVAVEKVKRDKIEAKVKAWQEAKTEKVLNRLKREEAIIQAWENEQKMKANIRMKRVERKLEEKRAKAFQKVQSKITRAHKRAEKRKAAERAKIDVETARVTAIVDRIRSTGKLPWKFYFF